MDGKRSSADTADGAWQSQHAGHPDTHSDPGGVQATFTSSRATPLVCISGLHCRKAAGMTTVAPSSDTAAHDQGAPPTGPFDAQAARSSTHDPAITTRAAATAAAAPSPAADLNETYTSNTGRRPEPCAPADTAGVAGPSQRAPATADAGAAGNATTPRDSATTTSSDARTQALIEASTDPHTVAMIKQLAEDSAEEVSGNPSQVFEQAMQLERVGEVLKAYPLLCRVALHSFIAAGPDHLNTFVFIHFVVENRTARGLPSLPHLAFLVSRVAQHDSGDRACTLMLVQQAALQLSQVDDARPYAQLTRAATQLAQQLPGELGWASAAATAVPDEEAYNRMVVQQHKAVTMLQGAINLTNGALQDVCVVKLAQEMLTRCVAYYDSLGPHWLGTQRKVQCLYFLNMCALSSRVSDADAEAYVLRAKKTAKRELGPQHPVALEAAFIHAHSLITLNRGKQAVSVMLKTLQQQQDVLGPHHEKVLENRVRGTQEHTHMLSCMPAVMGHLCICSTHTQTGARAHTHTSHGAPRPAPTVLRKACPRLSCTQRQMQRLAYGLGRLDQWWCTCSVLCGAVSCRVGTVHRSAYPRPSVPSASLRRPRP